MTAAVGAFGSERQLTIDEKATSAIDFNLNYPDARLRTALNKTIHGPVLERLYTN